MAIRLRRRTPRTEEDLTGHEAQAAASADPAGHDIEASTRLIPEQTYTEPVTHSDPDPAAGSARTGASHAQEHQPEAPQPAEAAQPEPTHPEPAQPGPAGLPQHTLPRTRLSGLWVAIGCFAIILIFLLIFILQNDHTVDIGFLGAHGHLPLGVAMLFAAIVGIGLAALAGTARILQLRATVRRNRRIDQRQKP